MFRCYKSFSLFSIRICIVNLITVPHSGKIRKCCAPSQLHSHHAHAFLRQCLPCENLLWRFSSCVWVPMTHLQPLPRPLVTFLIETRAFCHQQRALWLMVSMRPRMEQLITEGCRGLREAYSFFISYFSLVCCFIYLELLMYLLLCLCFRFSFFFSRGRGCSEIIKKENWWVLLYCRSTVFPPGAHLIAAVNLLHCANIIGKLQSATQRG